MVRTTIASSASSSRVVRGRSDMATGGGGTQAREGFNSSTRNKCDESAALLSWGRMAARGDDQSDWIAIGVAAGCFAMLHAAAIRLGSAPPPRRTRANHSTHTNCPARISNGLMV